jgi:hypothetical protein
MQIHLNPVMTRRVGVVLLAMGAAGMLARHYTLALKTMAHGNMADFSFGLLFGLGLALSLVTEWRDREEDAISIRPK